MATRDKKISNGIDFNKAYRTVFLLAVFTILYNIIEGFVATYFGFEEESLTLFGFGVDSFVEVISGTGIASMIWRIWNNGGTHRNEFEKTALKITGVGFYIIVVYLLCQSTFNIYTQKTPQNTLWGIAIAVVSIVIMWILIRWKTTLGNRLNSAAILADASCARVCLYMSFILLVSAVIYEYTGFQYSDSIGAYGIAYLSYKEGKECFEKSNSAAYCSCDH